MKIFTLKRHLRSAVGLAALFGAVAPTLAGVIIQPEIVIQPQVVVPQPMVVAPMVEYAPSPFDVYITNVGPADVVYLHGDTFIWAIDANGRRYRRFYAHGDHRAEVFHRRDELHHVMERNGGRLPERGAGRNEAHRAAEGRRDEHQARPGEQREERRDEHRDERR